MQVEIVVDASTAASLPGPKGLSERMAQPKSQLKSQPKSAASNKASNGTNGAGRGRGGKGRGRNGRPAKKTAEELDSEMADYFGNETTNGNENAAAPANGVSNGEAMEEEVLVRNHSSNSRGF